MNKWTWAVLFILSLGLAYYFFQSQRPDLSKLEPVKTKLQSSPLPLPEPSVAPAETLQPSSPLSGDVRPRDQNPPPQVNPVPQVSPPTYYPPPGQYEAPPPPPPPPQYTEPVEPFNPNPPPFEPPADMEFPEGVPPPPPPPPPSFPDEEF